MKLIYVAGKYSGSNYSEIENNIRRAEKASMKLWARGWAVITPHLNTAHFEQYEKVGSVNYITYNMMINGTMEMLKRCDAIFMLNDWAQSEGSIGEHQFAINNGYDIYYEDDGYPFPG